jgi:hypothetical protein
MAEQRCQACGRVEQVVPDGRGFPPDTAKRRLAKWCKANGCESDPVYTPTIRFGPRPCGQS